MNKTAPSGWSVWWSEREREREASGASSEEVENSRKLERRELYQNNLTQGMKDTGNYYNSAYIFGVFLTH